MDQDTDMYINDENETAADFTTKKDIVRKRGVLTDIEVNGKTISVVDPTIVLALEGQLKSLQSHVRQLESELRNLKNKNTIAERRMRDFAVELDNKVSYDRQ